MTYQELIAKALNGRTKYAMAKVLGITQVTLGRYVSGERLPDFDTAWKLAKEADVDPAEAFETLAEAQREHKSKQFKLQMGFVQIELVALLALTLLVPTVYIMSNGRRIRVGNFIVPIRPVRSHRVANVH